MKNLEYLFSEQATDIERMDFLLKMNERGITSDDVAKLVEYLLPKDFPKMPGAIDICGTGGSKLPRINTSTISAFILAQKGIKIAKHGNRASSGRFGSFDLLEALGFDIEKNADQLKNDFDKQNLAFIFAPKFFSALRHFANVRKEIGVPTIFNILGPLLNPAQPQIQIIGTNSEKNAKLLIESCRKMKKKKVAIVTSKGGLDEIDISNDTIVFELNDGQINDYIVSPEDFGIEKVDFNEIKGGDPEFNTKVTKDILRGNCDTQHKDLIYANSAFCLFFMGQYNSMKEAFCDIYDEDFSKMIL